MRILAAATTIVMLSATGLAQQPPTQNTPTPSDRAGHMAGADIAAALAKMPPDRPSSNLRVFSLGPYNVNIERRNPVAQGASAHDAVAELFYIVDGSATLLTGGTIPGATRNGTNLQGKAIEGGIRQSFTKGDWLIVPAGVPHQFVDVKSPVTIMSLYLPNPK
jgi:mannose-6-phosphate isomerase-like protein (cupin superfamily)